MERSFKEHVTFLEQRIHYLNREIMQNRLTTVERNHLQAEIRAAEVALGYYRKALEIGEKCV